MNTSPLLKRLDGFIAGQWRAADSRATIDVTNPATADLLARVPDMGADETTAAVEAARAAMTTVPTLDQRRGWLNAIASELITNKEELGRIVTLENGKPLKEGVSEVEYAAGFYSHFAKQLHHLEPEAWPEKIRGLSWTIHRRPAGVAGLITPWNFPQAMLAKKLGAAIAAGCGVVAKPAELTPLSAVALWGILEKIGYPKGMANLVIGKPRAIGDVLCTHPAVRVISFTGSTATGKTLLANTAPHVKRLALELGGNAPFIVFEDADLNAAADALMANKFRAGGQTCVCANRVYVQHSMQLRFSQLVAERVSTLRVGNGMDAGVDVGPLINHAAVEKVQRHVSDATSKGATVVVQAPLGGTVSGGHANYFAPTVLTDVRNDMLPAREETFGPVVSLMPFESEGDAIAGANGTPYGLAAYVFTRDGVRAQRVAATLQFGHVGLNTGSGPTPEAPFGGMKQSGLGREGGVEGMFEFCETQTIAGD